MKRNSLQFLVVLAVVASQLSCTSLQCGANASQFVEQYGRFIAEVDEMELSITDTRWKIYDQRLEMYIVDCYVRFKEELTFSDQQTVLMQGIRYYYKRYGSHMIIELQSDKNPASIVLRQEMASIWQRPDEIFRQLTGDDWEEMIGDFLNDLEEWKNKLQRLIEE